MIYQVCFRFLSIFAMFFLPVRTHTNSQRLDRITPKLLTTRYSCLEDQCLGVKTERKDRGKPEEFTTVLLMVTVDGDRLCLSDDGFVVNSWPLTCCRTCRAAPTRSSIASCRTVFVVECASAGVTANAAFVVVTTESTEPLAARTTVARKTTRSRRSAPTLVRPPRAATCRSAASRPGAGQEPGAGQAWLPRRGTVVEGLAAQLISR